MKKLFSVLLATVLMIGCLAACGEEEAYQLYTEMSAAMESITSVSASADAKVALVAADESIDLTMLMGIKQIIHSETDVEMAMDISADMGDQGAMDMTMYFKDGWLYQDVMGMKLKTPLSLEDAQTQFNSDMLSALAFEKEAVTSSSVENVNGGKLLKFTLSGDALGQMMQDMAGSALGALGGDVDMSFGDVSYTVLLGSDSLPLEQRIIFSMEMDVEGETATAEYDLNMTDFAYNSMDAIDYPADLDSYMEISM